jgi:hypothetical protein
MINKNELAKALEISKHKWEDLYWGTIDSDKLLDLVNNAIKNPNIFDSLSISYKGYKINESSEGFDISVDGINELTYITTRPDIKQCKKFIDTYLKTRSEQS